jgi:hypothetical protein
MSGHRAVFGGLIVNGVTSALFLFLIMGDRPVAAVIAGYAPSLPYNVLVSVGVLRSAARYDGDSRWVVTCSPSCDQDDLPPKNALDLS